MQEREIEILTERFLNGSATAEEKKLLNEWYNSKNDELVVVPSSHKGEREEIRLRVLNELQTFISDQKPENKVKIFKVRRRAFYAGIAASILLLLSVAYIFYQNTSGYQAVEQPLAMIEKSTKMGEKSTFRLPDGTKVSLNSGSSLVFPEHFDENGRTVMLKGEAFFDVKRDERRPFTVTSEKLLITVLGTSFNVKAYPEEDEKQVWVASGKVKVENNRNGEKDSEVKSVLLDPNQGIIFDPQTLSFEKKTLDIGNMIAWKDGWLIFESEEMGKVITSLERWYGVTIETSNEDLKKKKVTLKQHGESLSAVLEVLGYLADFDYKIENKQVRIIDNQTP